MKRYRFFLIVYSYYVFRLFYLHTGNDDRSLVWIVDGKLYDLLFIKIR